MTIIIRAYKTQDKEQVQHIHWETGFLGKNMSEIYTQKKQWAKKTTYYLEKEPQSCFVAENTKTKKIIEYIFGCLNDTNHNEEKEFYKELLQKIITYPFSNTKDKKFSRNTFRFLWSYLRGTSSVPKAPKNAGHIHINLLPEARRKGTGSKLLQTFFAYAKKNRAKTIHADSFQTTLNPNKNFWIQNGFKEFAKTKVDY